MPEPDEVRFACIGCGTMNPPGAESCAGCGHRFAGPGPGPAPMADLVGPPSPRPRSPSFNEYEPPAARPARLPTFRIGPAMGLIAVIAVGLAAFAADTALGFLSLLGLVPATIRSALVASGREAERRPMGLGELARSFAATFASAYLIALSSAIAFGITCFPIALSLSSPPFLGGVFLGACLGLAAAIAAGVWLTRGLLKMGRERADRERIRWH